MTLVPFLPRGELISRLEFETAILGTFEGEQRLARRSAPRLAVSMSFELFGDEIGDARTLARRIASGSGVIRLPDWRYAVERTFTAGQTTVDVGALSALYAVGVEVIILAPSGAFTSATVTAISGSELSLTAGPATALPRALVAPVWAGVCPEGVTISPEGHGFAIGSLSATLQGYPDLSGTTAPVIFAGIERFDAFRLRGADLSETVVREHSITDNGQGPIVASAEVGYTSGRLTISLEEQGPEAVLVRESFLHRRRGRAKPFFMSSDTIDLRAVGGTGGGTVIVETNATAAEITDRRLLLTLTTGAKTATRVLGAIDNGNGTLTLTVSPVLPTATEAAIATLSELALVRLDADGIEMRTSPGGLTRIAVPVWRLDHEL